MSTTAIECPGLYYFFSFHGMLDRITKYNQWLLTGGLPYMLLLGFDALINDYLIDASHYQSLPIFHNRSCNVEC